MHAFRKIWLAPAVTVGLFLLSRATAAHHGSASYTTDKAIVLKQAVVTEFFWTNPHSMLLFDVKDKDDEGGLAHWAGELGSPAAIRALGWKKISVRPGDIVTVRLYPSKFESDVGRVDTIVLADGTILKNSPRTDHGDSSQY